MCGKDSPTFGFVLEEGMLPNLFLVEEADSSADEEGPPGLQGACPPSSGICLTPSSPAIYLPAGAESSDGEDWSSTGFPGWDHGFSAEEELELLRQALGAASALARAARAEATEAKAMAAEAKAEAAENRAYFEVGRLEVFSVPDVSISLGSALSLSLLTPPAGAGGGAHQGDRRPEGGGGDGARRHEGRGLGCRHRGRDLVNPCFR